MANRQILWGPNLENVLNLGELYNLTTDRETREGSDFVQGGSGVEDSWVTGYDYTLAWEARFIPDKPGGSVSPVSGQTAWQGFLDWARRKNPFRFVPDDTAPLFYADNCYLMDPAKGFGAPGGDLKRVAPVKIRNAAQDFHAMLRGIMFEYAPGADITPLGLGGTFADAGVSGFLNNAGLFESAAINTLKDRHYPKGYSGGLPVLPRTTLLQAAATNKLTAPEDLSNAAWTKAGATIPSTNNTSPRGDATASFVREDGTTGFHLVQQAYTISAAANAIGAQLFLKARGRTKARIRLGDTSTNFFDAIVDLTAGTITSNPLAGTGTITFSQLVPLASGEYRLEMYGKMGTGTTVTLQVFLQNGAGADSYAGDSASGMEVWGCVATDNQIAGMYWGTGASRVLDTLSFPWPAAPQPMWVYLKRIAGSADLTGPVGNSFVCQIGNVFQDGRFIMDASSASGGALSVYHQANGNNSSVQVNAAPAIGDIVEDLGILNANGSVVARRSINGAADVVTGPSAVLAMRAAGWNPPTIFFAQGNPVPEVRLVSAKSGPLTFGGQTIDTIAKARAA